MCKLTKRLMPLLVIIAMFFSMNATVLAAELEDVTYSNNAEKCVINVTEDDFRPLTAEVAVELGIDPTIVEARAGYNTWVAGVSYQFYGSSANFTLNVTKKYASEQIEFSVYDSGNSSSSNIWTVTLPTNFLSGISSVLCAGNSTCEYEYGTVATGSYRCSVRNVTGASNSNHFKQVNIIIWA